MISILTQRALKVIAMQAVKARKKLSGTKPPKRDIYYFGYGANLNPTRFEKYSMNVGAVGVASLSDYKLNFNFPCEYKGKGFASIDPEKKSEVWGCLYKMDKASLLLLDIMEWAILNQYRKIKVTVKTADGKKHEAYTYRAKYPREGLQPSTQYKKGILKAAKEHGFPAEYIKEIEQIPSQDRFELDPGYSLMFPNKRRLLEKRLNRLYLAHDKLRERICEWLSF